MSRPILYSYFLSTSSWRVRIALALKKIDYDTKPVNILKKEQMNEHFMKCNPMQQVPVLVINGLILTQSLPIIEYLDEKFPQTPLLLPKDAAKRHKVREISEIINSGIQPLQNLAVIRMHSNDNDKRNAWSRFWVEKGFRALEHHLNTMKGKYCVGDEITMADCCLVPQVDASKRFDVDLNAYPYVKSIHERLSILKSFQSAEPKNQVDFSISKKN